MIYLINHLSLVGVVRTGDMESWSQDEFCHIGNSAEKMTALLDGRNVKLFLTDPPYNIGHKYGDVSDRLGAEDYRNLIRDVLKSAYDVADDSAHFFMIHYPEALAGMWDIITKETGWKFRQWITWAYPSNIGMSKRTWTRASRTVLWLVKTEGGEPPFHPDRIVRPYKNPWDKRVGALIESGKRGCSLYDWWEINLTKNVNKEKSDYSNQIPQTLLRRIIRSTTDIGDLVVDPFSGTYSTAKAALATGRLGWGCDLNKATKNFWPTTEDIDWYYTEEESSFDVEYSFDYERAGISSKQYRKILIEGIGVLRDDGAGKASEKLEDELRRMDWF